jgi:hypothetical protein
MVALVVSFSPGVAEATPEDPTKDQCIEANAQAQVLRRNGKLAAAREQLRICTVSSCPTMVRDDCAKRLDDLQAAQPSMIFDVKDAKGADVINVRVSVDGQQIADHLDGTPLNVDPGAHAFTFEADGHASVTRQLLIKEGEARREEHLIVGDAVAPHEAQPVPMPSETSPISTSSTGPLPPTTDAKPAAAPGTALGTQRIVGLTLSGIGAAAVGVGAVLGLLSESAWSSAKAACGGVATQCTNVPQGQSYHDTAETNATLSTAAFIGGGVLIAAGAALFFTATQHDDTRVARVRALPSVAPDQVSIAINGVFP